MVIKAPYVWTYYEILSSLRPIFGNYGRLAERADHVQVANECVNRMQKCLTQMNLQLANVIGDIMGQTGQRISAGQSRAGERNAEEAGGACVIPGFGHTEQEIVASLTGNWRPETVVFSEAGNGPLRFLSVAGLNRMRSAHSATSSNG